MTKTTLILLVIFTCSKAQVSRIIGGTDARVAQFPFAAAIYKTTNAGTFFCSGSILNDKWIITSGQCVDGALQFTIHLGSISLSDSNDGSLILSSSQYHLHPKYNSRNLQNDIGLIKLRMAVTFSEYIQPIVLNTFPVDDGTTVLTCGWGQISDSDPGLSDNLKYVLLSTISHDECSLIYGDNINENMVCAAGSYNEGTCNGDLGSPLIQNSGDRALVGISSFISGNGCESTEPSGFTKIYPYLDWITQVIAN